MTRDKLIRNLFAGFLIILCIACCMLPVTYKGSIQQSMQEGLIIYDNGVQDLILKVSPEISGDKTLNKF